MYMIPKHFEYRQSLILYPHFLNLRYARSGSRFCFQKTSTVIPQKFSNTVINSQSRYPKDEPRDSTMQSDSVLHNQTSKTCEKCAVGNSWKTIHKAFV